MNKVLVWHDKHGMMMYDASTRELEDAAYLAIFNTMLKQGDYEACPPETNAERVFELAKQGDPKGARAFLNHRSSSDYEYERIEICTVNDPTKK